MKLGPIILGTLIGVVVTEVAKDPIQKLIGKVKSLIAPKPPEPEKKP